MPATAKQLSIVTNQCKHTGPDRSVNLSAPATFTLLFIFIHNRTIRLCVAAVLGLPVFCKQAYPAKKGRENTTTPPPLLLIFSSPRLERDGYLLLRLSSKRSEEGEREELITNRPRRFVPKGQRGRLYLCWVCVKRSKPSEEGERMRGSYHYRPAPNQAGRLVSTGFVKRVQTQAKKKRVYVYCYRHHPRRKRRRRCRFCAGPVN
jgi:hypothetical protein